MSAEADQVQDVKVEEPEKLKEAAKATIESQESTPQENGISENGNTEADESEKDNDESQKEEAPVSKDAPTEPEKIVEVEIKEEVKEAESEATPAVAPPQIIVDTVPDRDPESPTEPEAPKPAEETKAEAAEPAKTEEEKPAEEKVEEKVEAAPEAASAAAEESKEEEKAETKEQNDTSASSAAEPAAAAAATAAAATSETPEVKKEEEVKAEDKKDEGEKAEEKKEDGEKAEDKKEEASSGATAASGKPDFNGKYKQVSVECDNLDAFFQALGVPWLLRKVAVRTSPSTEVRQEGDKFHLKFVTGFITKEVKFTVGEEFEDGGMGFKKELNQVVPSWDGDKLVLVMTPKNDKTKSKPLKQTREMDGERMSLLFEIGDLKCKRIFERKK